MASFSEIINSDKPVLVDFFATWCGPCKTMSPILDDLKSKLGNTASVLKVDIDKNPHAAERFQVRSVPTLILFKKGKILWKQSGVIPANQLAQIIKQHQ
ncbi:MAG: thioredoxin [Fluviicola sp.]|jgi:thioredoxin 1